MLSPLFSRLTRLDRPRRWMASAFPVTQQFEFSDRFDVLRTARRSLERDEFVERHDAAWLAEQVDHGREWFELFERAAAGDVTEQVQRAEAGVQREVQTPSERGLIERKREPRRRAAQIRRQRDERPRQALEVVVRATVDDVQVQCRAGRPADG